MTRYIIGAVDHEKQHKSEQVDTDQDRDGVQDPADDVSGQIAASFSRRRKLTTAGTMLSPSSPAATARGHNTGSFQRSLDASRKAGSIRVYLSVLLAMVLGLMLCTQ